MKEAKKGGGGVPVAIIVLVAALMIVGGFWFYRSSNPANRVATPANNSSAATPNSKPALNWANLPSGAQPPNAVGSPNATVTIEEFADFQCGSCAAAHPVLKEVIASYASNKNFRFVFRNYPLSMHDKAYDAAVAAEAAGLQGTAKYWQMQDRIFSNQATWSANSSYRDLFAKYAEEIGLDITKFKADMSGMLAKQRVDNDLTRGRAVGITSTPSVFINGRLIPYAEVSSPGLRRIIDAELQTAAAPATNNVVANPAAPAANANANK